MKRIIIESICCLSACLVSHLCLAQKDSLVLKNRNVIVGEVKSLDKGVLIIETSYSDKDFQVEWSGIKEIYTVNSFLQIHQSGRRANSPLQSVPGTDSVKLLDDGAAFYVRMQEIVYLKELKSKFWSRMDASIDVGINFTRANNLRQYNMNTRVGYTANKWQLTATYADNRSRQDSISATKRTEANFDYKYFLQHNWFLATSINFLHNTEQALKLRTTGKLGAGKFLVRTNRQYWGVGTGVSINNESFSNEKEAQNSPEWYVTSELNLFDLKNLNLLGNIFIYKSLTDAKRWRSDIKLDIKYDLPFDFYIKPGFTLNYDNRPAIEGNEIDYVFTFSIGWEL
jgi:hypothetical protein